MKVKLLKERDIIFEVYGLRPLTRYYFYVNSTQNTSRIKQFGKKLADPLVTDENGYMKLVYYIDSGIPTDTMKGVLVRRNNLNYRPIEVVLTTIDQTTIPTNFETSAVSYAKTTLF
ncbi:hypothetical protein EB118_03005 [bacterium]|nr:hypothetical protein [bacterium]